MGFFHKAALRALFKKIKDTELRIAKGDEPGEYVISFSVNVNTSILEEFKKNYPLIQKWISENHKKTEL
jgi:hypothetical protein